jgi:hypothetical protein
MADVKLTFIEGLEERIEQAKINGIKKALNCH